MTFVRLSGAGLLAIAFSCALCSAGDWPQWGRDDSKNMVSPEKGLPDAFKPGKPGRTLPLSMDGTENVKWIAKLGSITYGSPVIAGGKVFIGTSDDAPGLTRKGKAGGGLLCFDEKTGKPLWQIHIPGFTTNLKSFNFDHLSAGVCGTPIVEGDFVYFVSNRDEVVCATVSGQGGTGAGAKYNITGGGVIWVNDMINSPPISCWPQDACCSSIVIKGDLLYVCPDNGVDASHSNIPRPNAPSIAALEKRTGKVVGMDEAHVGPHIFHGEWSSPTLATVGDKTLVLHGAGNGMCYGFDTNPAGGILKTVFSFDVNPPEHRTKGGVALKYKSKDGPSEVIGTPVVYKNRVYVNVGQDPNHGHGAGNMVCMDLTKTGDISKTGLIWQYGGIDRSLSTPSIVDGLVFVADFSGQLHCLDADTGKLYWKHDMEAGTWGSTLAADGKVYIGTERGDLWIFAAAKDKKVMAKIRFDNKIATAPAAANGVLYVATVAHLYAIGK